MLGITPDHFAFQLSVDWLQQELSQIWKPLLLGCLVSGTLSALVGNLAVRLVWRWHIWEHLKQRKARQ